MSVGTGAAIMMGVSAAASLYGAHKQAQAAKDASQQQIDAANKAMAMQTPLYTQALGIAQQQAQQGRADLAPYAQQGGQGLSALTSLLGVSSAPAAARSAPQTQVGVAQPGAAPGGAPAMVLLRAPNGQTQSVPASQAEFFIARGAQRV